MEEPGSRMGVARLDGLLSVSWPADPATDQAVREALRRLAQGVPVHLNVQREPGRATVLPAQEPFPFAGSDRPGERLLPLVRDLVETIEAVGPVQVESTLRIQEFLGDRVREGVFVHEEGMGVTLAARERPARPEERPELPEAGIAERAESFFRRRQWLLLAAAAVLGVLVWLGWESGWWGIGSGSLEGPSIDEGPLEGIVAIEKVRSTRQGLTFDVKPGPEFARFDEVAGKCSLRKGIFRVVLLKDGAPTGPVLALDLSGLPGRAAGLKEGDTVRYEVPYRGSGFDAILICP